MFEQDDHYIVGLVNTRINKWIPLSFCLPQKVHQWHLRGKIVEPEDIDRHVSFNVLFHCFKTTVLDVSKL